MPALGIYIYNRVSGQWNEQLTLTTISTTLTTDY